ncbi:MAG: hypothetical protein V4560_15480 [Bacteroidota bacterium]
MLDKEFDGVFNSKFEDFEVEPSPMVWDNIDAELGDKKTKGTIMPWLSIAATIIVLFTAGILFMKKDRTVDKPAKSDKLATNHLKQTIPVRIDEPVKKDDKVTVITKSGDKIASNKNYQPKNSLSINTITAPVVHTKDNTPVQPQTINPDNKQLIAAVPDPASTHIIATVPDNDVKLAPVQTNAPVERPIVMASADNQETAPVKKRGIHSFGGLINVLVAKIDKRPDKIIEFTDSDDDDAESNITGVNLGLVKIKKQ